MWAGRFTEIVSKYGGDVIGIDLSYSVDVTLKNLGVKASINFILIAQKRRHSLQNSFVVET